MSSGPSTEHLFIGGHLHAQRQRVGMGVSRVYSRDLIYLGHLFVSSVTGKAVTLFVVEGLCPDIALQTLPRATLSALQAELNRQVFHVEHTPSTGKAV